MKINIKAFATVKDIIGYESGSLEVSEKVTAGEVIGILTEKHPELKKIRDILITAVNEEYKGDDTILKQGDTLAVFPPVSGG